MMSKYLKHGEIFSFIAFVFFIFILVFFGENQQSQDDLKEMTGKNDSLGNQLGKMEEEYKNLQDKYKNLQDKYSNLEKEFTDLKENKLPSNIYPPIIRIPGTGKYAFPSGEANLTSSLKEFIDRKVDIIVNNLTNDNTAINIIEVIGHTDLQRIDLTSKNNCLKPNLDNELNKVATTSMDIDKLCAGSNVDLGLMRSLSVVKYLQQKKMIIKAIKSKGLNKDKVFRAYSAGQLYMTNGEIAPHHLKGDPDRDRRRIEIRFTRESVD